jgi:hypothetical protein
MKHGDTTLLDVRSRFPDPRFEIISVQAAREMDPASLFLFKSFEVSADKHICPHSHHETRFRTGRRERCLDSRSLVKHGDTTLLDVRSRFPDPRIKIISARTAREIGPVSRFRLKSFEISADIHLCQHSQKATHFRIGRRECFLDSRSVELAMRFTTENKKGVRSLFRLLPQMRPDPFCSP